jgi:Asp-tRNA(Asn)/Glu-tRNA(Gln) amidotransferase A subunit family amidase
VLGEDIFYLSVRELSQRIRSRKLSPVELTESYLQRSERIGAKLNAYATLTRDLALREARQAEREIRASKYRGPLHGIPYAAKDLLAVKGYPTSWGARPFANQKFGYDATVIKKLQSAGAILIGKAAMIELAGGMGYRFASASISGAAKNPWDQTCWTCVERLGRNRQRRTRSLCGRHGNLGLDRVPFGVLWRVGVAADLRPGEPPRSDGTLVFDGQDRCDGPHRG